MLRLDNNPLWPLSRCVVAPLQALRWAFMPFPGILGGIRERYSRMANGYSGLDLKNGTLERLRGKCRQLSTDENRRVTLSEAVERALNALDAEESGVSHNLESLART